MLLRLGVVEVIEHQVHILLRFRRQFSFIQVLVILIDCDSNTTLGNVAGCSRSFRQFFRILLKLLLRCSKLGVLLLAKTSRAATTLFGSTTHPPFIVMLLRWILNLHHLSLVLTADARHVVLACATIVALHVHHMVVYISIDLLRRLLPLILLFPTAGSGDWEVFYDAFVFTRCQHVSHASLIHVESTELRYLAFVICTLVEL